MWWKVIIITLAYFLMGAHFMRYGNTIMIVVCALMPLLMFIKRPWTSKLLSSGLVLGSVLVWGVATFGFVEMRMAVEAPWLRLAVIMSAVIAFTLFAAYLCTQLQPKKGLFH